MNELLHLNYSFETRKASDETRSVDVVASSMAIDSYGEIVLQDWDLARFMRNPVVLYGHNSGDLPIGHASNVRLEDGKLLATLNLVDEKANPMAERVWQGIKQGSLRAVSVGFYTKNKPAALEIDGKAVLALSGNELLEISVVPIPANPEAVALAAKSLEAIRSLARAAKKDPDMSKAINIALALSADADEASALAAVAALKGLEKDLCQATGKTSTAEALGAVAAALESNKTLAAQVADLTKAGEARDREDLIRAGIAAKKLTPAQATALREKDLAFVRGYIELAHPNPALSGPTDEPEFTPAMLEWNGKKWNELAPMEKHQLHDENPELYAAMRDAAARA
jgi:HK97 family phage prohead protease